MEYWGYHLILDCKNGALEQVKSVDNIKRFVEVLVKEIEMTMALYSLVQLIETSSITGHFVDKNGDCYIDIFSCKSFDIETAKSVVNKYFSPKQIKVTYLTRQA